MSTSPFLVLYVYVEQFPELASFLEKLRKAGFKVVECYVEVGDDYSYSRELANHWNKGFTLVILEQDILPTVRMVKDLVTCSHPLCAQSYYVYPTNTLLDKPYLAHRVVTEGILRWLGEGEEWSDYFGLGLTKISEEVQSRVSIPSCHWKFLNHNLSEACYKAGFKCHVHTDIAKHLGKE